MMCSYKKTTKTYYDNALRLAYKGRAGNIFSSRCLHDTNFNKKVPNNIFSTLALSSKIRNRCLFTGKSVAVLSIFRVSKLKFRKLVQAGLMPGVSKAL